MKQSEYNKTIFENFSVPFKEPRVFKSFNIVKKYTPGKILDIGCSTGDFIFELKKLGWNTFGVDISYNALKKSREKNLNVILNDLSFGLPFKDESFDYVYTSEVIEHVLDTSLFLKEIYRVLRPHGTLFLTTPNMVSLTRRITLFFGMQPPLLGYDFEHNDAGHVRYYTSQVLYNHIKEHGFKIKKSLGDYIHIPRMSYFFKKICSFPASLPILKNFSNSFIVIAEKI